MVDEGVSKSRFVGYEYMLAIDWYVCAIAGAYLRCGMLRQQMEQTKRTMGNHNSFLAD